MKLRIDIDVDIGLSTATEKRLLRGGILAAVLLGGATLAYADWSVPVTWSQGQPLRSADLNNNFAALADAGAVLQAQVAALAPKPPTVSTALVVGSATGTGGFANGIYTTPPGVVWLEIKMVGGGGGGGPSGSTAGTPGMPGGATTFGGTVLVANGGEGAGNGCTGPYALGGSAVVMTSATVIPVKALAGGAGVAPATINGGLSYQYGGAGAASALGGGGFFPGVANTGAGGSGAEIGAGPGCTAWGGAAGGYIEANIVPTPAQAFAYSVGDGGQGGTAGTSGQNGYAGGSGGIWVIEHYQ